MPRPEENKAERPNLIKTLSRSLQRVPTGGNSRRASEEKEPRDSMSPKGEARKHIPQGRGGAGMSLLCVVSSSHSQRHLHYAHMANCKRQYLGASIANALPRRPRYASPQGRLLHYRSWRNRQHGQEHRSRRRKTCTRCCSVSPTTHWCHKILKMHTDTRCQSPKTRIRIQCPRRTRWRSQQSSYPSRRD